MPAAKEILEAEAKRLRSGAGGWGGRSPEAIRLANAIEMLLAADAPERIVELRARVESADKAIDALESIGEQARQRIVDLAAGLREALGQSGAQTKGKNAMKVTTFKCDGCGVELDEDDESRSRCFRLTTPFASAEIDICSLCWDKMLRALGKRRDPATRQLVPREPSQ